MTATALYSAFLPILRLAGRWLIRRAVKWGIPKLITFIECRIDVIETKLSRARTHRRKRWLRWRIEWRRTVLVWLKRYRAKLQARMVRTLNKYYDKGLERLPWDAVGERYSDWRKKHA
jgi:hypothetical protein